MAEKKRATPMPQVPQTKDKGTVGDPEGFHPPKPGKEDDKHIREKTLDKTIADSFPTSDPPSSIPDPSEDSGGDDSFAA